MDSMTDSENLDEFVSLRNTISGAAMEVTRRKAQEILSHPVFGAVNEVVRTPKPEVLTDRSDKPDTDDVDNDKAETPKNGK